MRLEGQIKEKSLRLQELLDWLTKAEQALGAEQPMNEQSQPLAKQYSQHKVNRITMTYQGCIYFVFERAKAPKHFLFDKRHPMRTLQISTGAFQGH